MDVESGSVNRVYHETGLVSDIALVANLNLLPQFVNELFELNFTSKNEITSCEEGGEGFGRLFGIVVVKLHSEIGLNSLVISNLFLEMVAQTWLYLLYKVRDIVGWGSRKEVDLLQRLAEG